MRLMPRLPFLVLLALAFLTQGCGPKEYGVRGVIKEVRPAEGDVVIRHDPIPGYMEAMTMPFRVRDASILSNLHAGDTVAFRLSVTRTESWSDSFRVLEKAPATNAPAPSTTVTPEPGKTVLNDPSGVSFYKDVPELKPGDPLPPYTLTNQDGRAFTTADFRGRVLVLNFIFTRCPLPDFCPRESTALAAAIKQLRRSGPTNFHVVSVSFDPEHDTPKALAAYGRRYGHDPSEWTFATGSFDNIQPLGSHFGLYFSRAVTPDNMNHNLRTVVVQPDGKVSDIILGNRWAPGQLADAVALAATNAPTSAPR
jgi:protein SCO1/2